MKFRIAEAKRTPKEIIQAIDELMERWERAIAKFNRLSAWANSNPKEVNNRYDKLHDKLLRELEKTDKEEYEKYIKTISHPTWV